MNFFNPEGLDNTNDGMFPMTQTNVAGYTDESNSGVDCYVDNCVYHDGTNRCTAKQIHVGPFYANSSADTSCATFRVKKSSAQF